MKKLISIHVLFLLEAFIGLILYIQKQVGIFPQSYYNNYNDAIDKGWLFLLLLLIFELFNLFRIIKYKKGSVSIPFLLFVFYDSIIMRYYDIYPQTVYLKTFCILLLLTGTKIFEIVYMKLNKQFFQEVYKNILFSSIYDIGCLFCFYILV